MDTKTIKAAIDLLSEADKTTYKNYNVIHFAYCGSQRKTDNIENLSNSYNELINETKEFLEALENTKTIKDRRQLISDFNSILKFNIEYNTVDRQIRNGNLSKEYKEEASKLKEVRDTMSEDYRRVCDLINTHNKGV